MRTSRRPREWTHRSDGRRAQADVPGGSGDGTRVEPSHHNTRRKGWIERNGEEAGQGREEEGRQEAVSCLTRQKRGRPSPPFLLYGHRTAALTSSCRPTRGSARSCPPPG